MATTLSSQKLSSGQLDVINFVVNQGHGVKALADLSLGTVPANYILPAEERLGEVNTNSKTYGLTIPIIDVENWEDSPTVHDTICDAARKWGFFQIVNHGIPIEVLDNVLEASHRFYGLPVEERKEYYFRSIHSGDTCQLRTSFMPHKEKVLEWKDFLLHHICCSENAKEVMEGNDLPKGFSRWPTVSRNEVLEYINCARPVMKNLIEILMKGINVKKIEEGTGDALMGTLTTNINYYPKCPNPDLTNGIAPHTDATTITILLQDETGGLYIRWKEENIWIPVEPVKGALVINIGDVFQIMSNDQYHSIEHRVSTNTEKNRISIPIFVKPGPDTIVKPLDEVVDDEDKPRYKPVLFSDYFRHFVGKPHDGRQTFDYAKI